MRRFGLSRVRVILVIAVAASVITFLVLLIGGCSRPMTDAEASAALVKGCNHNVNQFLLDKLEQNRIVMLADAGHGRSLYLQTVISFLNYWLDSLETSTNTDLRLPAKLILVLETDSAEGTRLERFFKTGNIYDAMDIRLATATQFSWEKVEFYSDLRDIWLRAGKYQAGQSNTRNFLFEICCPESTIDAQLWSRARGAQFFFHERDEYSSSQIIARLDSDPEAKALIFYGAAHLNRERTVKMADSLRAEGYFMAHYLQERYGDKTGLYTVFQLPISEARAYSMLFDAPGSTYAIDNSVIAGANSLERMATNTHGGSIFWYCSPSPSVPVARTSTMNLAKFLAQRLDILANIDNEFNRMGMNEAMRFLHTISGVPLSPIRWHDSLEVSQVLHRWLTWSDTAHVDAVRDITSLALWKRLVDNMAGEDRTYTSAYETLIGWWAGFTPYHDTTMTPRERADECWQFIQTNRSRIVINNLIPILWLGNPDEIAKAKDALTKETGLHWSTAKEWTLWWRRNYVALPEI